MMTFSGIGDLLAHQNAFPESGWIFVEKSFDTTSEKDIREGRFCIAQDDDEEFDLEETHCTWLEAPMFRAIVGERLEKNPAAPLGELIAAAIHYLDKDTFMP
ncbi:hypothetical protein INH39_18035 [Massilia violaceinigra]|uniref:CDI immunity protein domain-containing protein n=1 Tax=Massilia violaceinigra TaxID=2045208 RepID=A0ABY4A1H4_9BURK|nr:hypothetical protein [Massilia violaceinigra]UOD27431.1 hypothetical protein INH39_18035 [Massilia violaceinigra]